MLLFLELMWAHLYILIIREKYILILSEGPTQGLDDTTLTAEAIYPINFTQPNKRFVSSLHYNENNSFLFVNATQIHKFKARDYEIKDYMHCVHVIFKKILQLMNFNPIDTSDVLDIHKYLSKNKTWFKKCFV